MDRTLGRAVSSAPSTTMAFVCHGAAGAETCSRCAQIDFGIVEENAGDNKLHMRRVSKGMTIHVPQGERRMPVAWTVLCATQWLH